MIDPHTIPERAAEPAADVAAERAADPGAQIRADLVHAARLAADDGASLDDFMRAAWLAFMEARPGLREELEEMRLSAELDEMRRLGRVGAA